MSGGREGFKILGQVWTERVGGFENWPFLPDVLYVWPLKVSIYGSNFLGNFILVSLMGNR